jgi:alpha-tubulin suppressor-like RCC1 family protein
VTFALSVTVFAVPLDGQQFTQVSAGIKHTCALQMAGAVYCWGGNFWGQLGTGDTLPRSTPTAGPLPLAASELEIGATASCVRLTNGEWYCWGENESGQLGTGDTIARARPTAVGRPPSSP